MQRWNDTVDATPTSTDFHWRAYDQFPHPTNKGGSEQAYGDFAQVLLSFFQRGDDFDFLAQNNLFRTPLRYLFANGQDGDTWTFQGLTADFSSDTGFGNAPAATRDALRGYLGRM